MSSSSIIIDIDWENSISCKLSEIERSCILGEYVDTFDAASLSSCFLPDEEEAIAASTRKPELKGLSRLVLQLTLLLNEAYILQQTAVSSLQAECSQCSKIACSNIQQNPEESNKIRKHQQSNSGSKTSVKSGSSWASIPSADYEDIDGPSKPLTQRLAAMLTKSDNPTTEQQFQIIQDQLQRQIQHVHDRTTAMINAKLHAFEVIAHCCRTYINSIVPLATKTGVSRASNRAALLIDYSMASIRSHKFLETHEAEDIMNFVRELWASTYIDNRKCLAERRLLLTNELFIASKSQHTLYIKVGVGLTLLAWAISECFNNEQGGREIWHDPTFAIFMCFGDLLLLLWMWGLSMQIWRGAGIDFVRLLNLQDTDVGNLRGPEVQVFASATNHTLIFLAIFICFNKAARGVLYIHGSLAVAHSMPTLMVIYFMYSLLMPLETRGPWLGFLSQVLAAPCFPVQFRDGYIGDLLTSLVRVLIPMCFSFAYLIMSAIAWLRNDMRSAASTSDLWWQESALFRLVLVPFLTLFPLWIRLMQCLRRSVETGKRWPHMANALKYTSAIVVISFGTFHPQLRNNSIWIAGFIFATLFQYTWDLTMDWGIVVAATSPTAGSSSWGGMALRRTRLLGPMWIYVAVMACNLVLRFAWALTLLPSSAEADSASLYGLLLAYLAPLVAAAEILRRMVWGFFRLEHEQLEVLGANPVLAVSLAGMDQEHDGAPDAKSFPAVDEGERETAFERMAVNSPHSAWDPDGRYSTLPNMTRAFINKYSPSECFELDWLPLPRNLVDLVARVSWLDNKASFEKRTRLVEALLFAGLVIVIIGCAAWGA